MTLVLREAQVRELLTIKRPWRRWTRLSGPANLDLPSTLADTGSSPNLVR